MRQEENDQFSQRPRAKWSDGGYRRVPIFAPLRTGLLLRFRPDHLAVQPGPRMNVQMLVVANAAFDNG